MAMLGRIDQAASIMVLEVSGRDNLAGRLKGNPSNVKSTAVQGSSLDAMLTYPMSRLLKV